MRTVYSLLLLLPVLATQASDEGPIEQVVVSGTRFEQSALLAPAPVFVIDHEQISLSGARQLAELLQGQAGIQLRDTIGDGGRGVVVAMRGFGENAANNTLVLVDGRRLNNPTLQPPDLNSISLKDVERVEILAGGAGVLFGDQAVGGVINVITRQDEQRSARLELSLGSHDTRQARIRYGNRFDNGLGVQLSAERRDGDNYRDNNDSEYSNLFSRAVYRWTSGELFAEYQYVDDQLRLPGALLESLAREDRRQTLFPNDFADLETETWRGGLAWRLHPHWRLLAEASRRDSEGNGYQFAENDSDMEVVSVNPRLVAELPARHGEVLLTAGLDYVDSDYGLDIPDFFFQSASEQQLLDVYAQLSYPLHERLVLSSGLRASRVDDHNRVSNQHNSDSETLLTAALSWYLREDMRLLLRRDETLRYANVDENGFVLPSVDFLKPQRGESLELGYEWQRERVGIQATLFRLDLDDEILYDPSAAGPGAAFGFLGANINLDSSRRQGATLSAYAGDSGSWRLAASYNWTDAEIRSGNLRGNTVPYVAEHSGSLSGSYRLNAWLQLYTEAVYLGSRYALGDDGNGGPKAADYWLLNSSLQAARGHWSLSLRVNNLLEEKYNSLSTWNSGLKSVYPAAERTWIATVAYSL